LVFEGAWFGRSAGALNRGRYSAAFSAVRVPDGGRGFQGFGDGSAARAPEADGDGIVTMGNERRTTAEYEVRARRDTKCTNSHGEALAVWFVVGFVHLAQGKAAE
jgi:hypothetical protein